MRGAIFRSDEPCHDGAPSAISGARWLECPVVTAYGPLRAEMRRIPPLEQESAEKNPMGGDGPGLRVYPHPAPSRRTHGFLPGVPGHPPGWVCRRCARARGKAHNEAGRASGWPRVCPSPRPARAGARRLCRTPASRHHPRCLPRPAELSPSRRLGTCQGW